MGADPNYNNLQQYSLATSNSSSSNKRARGQAREPIYISSDGEDGLTLSTNKRRKRDAEQPPAEKRLKRFRPTCPIAVQERIHRVHSQRLFILGRERDDCEGFPTEKFDIAGTTGNIYQVDICQVPTCTCPDSAKVMIKALKAQENLTYQAGLLTTELREIFENAPPPSDGKTDDQAGNRKPLEEDDCPICYEGFVQGEKNTVFCRAQCGTNLHKECFRKWASQAKDNGKGVTCVMCRSKWELDSEVFNTEDVLAQAAIGEDGYANVGEALGLSSQRDTSSYHTLGMNRKYGWGYNGSSKHPPRRRY